MDTGSTYTAVPREMLQTLGVPVERSLPSETQGGRPLPVDVGEATIRVFQMSNNGYIASVSWVLAPVLGLVPPSSGAVSPSVE